MFMCHVLSESVLAQTDVTLKCHLCIAWHKMNQSQSFQWIQVESSGSPQKAILVQAEDGGADVWGEPQV